MSDSSARASTQSGGLRCEARQARVKQSASPSSTSKSLTVRICRPCSGTSLCSAVSDGPAMATTPSPVGIRVTHGTELP